MFRRALLWMLFFFLMFFLAAFFLSSCSPAQAPTLPTAEPQLIIQAFPPTSVPTATPVVIPPTATPTPEGPVFYTVEAGDTLAQIAERFGFKTSDLSRANHLANADLIYVGQILLLATPDPLDGPQSPNKVGQQIVVVLSEQMTYVYEDGTIIKSFLISSGVATHPTVQGNFRIQTKLELDDMAGPGYDLKDVPWVMYFYQGYSFHGTYWHSNFGTPMSHGCLNMKIEDADWLFHWAEVGTPVLILP